MAEKELKMDGSMISTTDVVLFADYIQKQGKLKDVEQIAQLYFSERANGVNTLEEISFLEQLAEGLDETIRKASHDQNAVKYVQRISDLKNNIEDYVRDAKPLVTKLYEKAPKVLAEILQKNPKPNVEDYDKIYSNIFSEQEGRKYVALEKKAMQVYMELLQLNRDFIKDAEANLAELPEKEKELYTFIASIDDIQIAKFVKLYEQFKNEQLERRYGSKSASKAA